MHWRRRCFWLCYAVGMPIGHKAYYYCDCINEQAYNITKQRSYVVVKVGDQEKQTSVGIGLDPTWEETFEFDVGDENTTKCFVKFMMGAEGEEKQIGDECE
eukprot:GHUV01041160.1.p1 GENE.GHUV01041160.1~~GHUV01041160.1.p1  ORF type:complete len:101 (-),score=12.37 GHUV01041160.1:247-549(-)